MQLLGHRGMETENGRGIDLMVYQSERDFLDLDIYG